MSMEWFVSREEHRSISIIAPCLCKHIYQMLAGYYTDLSGSVRLDRFRVLRRRLFWHALVAKHFLIAKIRNLKLYIYIEGGRVGEERWPRKLGDKVGSVDDDDDDADDDDEGGIVIFEVWVLRRCEKNAREVNRKEEKCARCNQARNGNPCKRKRAQANADSALQVSNAFAAPVVVPN